MVDKGDLKKEGHYIMLHSWCSPVKNLPDNIRFLINLCYIITWDTIFSLTCFPSISAGFGFAFGTD